MSPIARRLRSALLGAALALPGLPWAAPSTARLTPQASVLDQAHPRYGLNLGGGSTWGAEQLQANVLKNPGFEAVLDRALVVVKQIRGRRISDDSVWLARADGFWSAARYDVRTGAAAGAQGRVLDSRAKGEGGLPELTLDDVAPGLAAGDVLALSAESDPLAAPLWWTAGGRISATRTQVRPGSLGRQSLKLAAIGDTPATLLHHLDTISERAGKLLPVEGPWLLSFWARANTPNTRLRVSFRRHGSAAYLQQSLSLAGSWQQYRFPFTASEAGRPNGALELAFTLESGEALLDDCYLGEAAPEASGFRKAVVDTLSRLRPGYLRDWQGQLGDTLANRIAAPDARQPSRYRPGASEILFHYSLPEFLALCAQVQAQPWIVAPTTLSDAEWRDFGRWIAQARARYRLREVLIEFGNENWNGLFRAAGIPDTARHRAAAERAFRLLREGAGPLPGLRLVLGGQLVAPPTLRALAATRGASDLAVAPYFAYRAERGARLDQLRAAALAESDAPLREAAREARAGGKRLVAYELNLHTTTGDADAATRDALVAGPASAAALARRLLQGSLTGASTQAVYTLAGFDTFIEGSRQTTRLFGIARDLATAYRLRPTGLALELLNEVAGGRAQSVLCTGSGCATLTALVFDQRRWAVVSSAAAPTELELPCPSGELLLAWIDGGGPERDNEATQRVAIERSALRCAGPLARVRLPPHSLLVARDRAATAHAR